MILVKKTDNNVDEGIPDSESYLIAENLPISEESITADDVRDADVVYLSYATYESLGPITDQEINTLKKIQNSNMTSRDFAYWLQGFFENADPKTISKKQTEMIKKHLALVFFHEIDPSYTDDPVKQQKMNEIHEGKKEKKKEEKKEEISYNSNGIFPSERDVVYRC